MFPAERIAVIFGNIEDVHEFARTFLADLQKHIVTRSGQVKFKVGSV